jgi:hypothetical protein
MDCLQTFPTRELSIFEYRCGQKLNVHVGTIETKSAHMIIHDVYSIIFELIKELYVDRVLTLDHSFSTSHTLTFREECFIKHLSIYLSHVVLGHSMRKIAQGFNVDRTSVYSYA